MGTRESPRRGPAVAEAGTGRGRSRWAIFLGVALSAGFSACNVGARGGEPAEPVATTRVDMPRHYRFEPAAIRVTKGSTVTWRNSDDFTHSVRLGAGDGQVHNVPPGDSVSITFDRPGEYRYRCTFHPHDMRGVVIVTAPPSTGP